MPNPPLPTWYTPEQAAAPTVQPRAAQAAAPPAMPGWYTPEPAATSSGNESASPILDNVNDIAANAATGLLRVPGAIGGLPHMLAHTKNWVNAQGYNAISALTGNEKRFTGEELDKQDPIASSLPSAAGIDEFIKNPPHPKALDFLFNKINGSGEPGEFYTPKSVGGRLFQAGVTGAASGGTNLPNALKTGAAAMAAEGTNELFPDNPALAALAALVTHTGGGLAGKTATKGFETFVAPNVSAFGIADRAGQRAAARAITEAGDRPGALNNPSDAKLAADKKAVGDITQPWGPGVANHQAGETLRESLQGRADHLTSVRGKAADDAYGVFKNQPPMPGEELAPFMASPAFRSAVKSASAGRLNRGQDPLTTLFKFDEANAGEPTLIPNAAVPPDVLQRIKGSLDDAIAGAKGNVERGDLTDLRSRYVAAIDARYPQTYPSTRAEFAANSRPLDDFTEGKTGKILDAEKKFGRSPQYTMDAERITDKYLTSNGTTSDFEQLQRAFGGDKGPTTALKVLRENLIHKVQDAIAPDGTLSQAAFDKAIGPYKHNLQMRFPGLAKEFENAKAAQATMDLGIAQRSLTDAVEGGALRAGGTDGAVTRTSALQWMTANKKTLAQTHTPAELHRLRALANSLPEGIGAGADAAVEAAPMIVGGSVGGLEGGVLGGITHKIPAFLAGPGRAQFRAGYNAAVEKAFTDPVEGARLSALAAKQRGMTGQQALLKAIQQSVKSGALATPTATLAGRPVP